MSEKKVAAVIVKGPSEEAALGSILKEYFSNEEVQFVVVHGDITIKDYTSGKINGIQYKIYFNSCNLEHVLYNQLKDFTDAEKEEMSDDFAEMYEGKVDEFIDFISNKPIAVEGNYRQTWKFIEKGTNSLNRFSNMHLIFEKK